MLWIGECLGLEVETPSFETRIPTARYSKRENHRKHAFAFATPKYMPDFRSHSFYSSQ